MGFQQHLESSRLILGRLQVSAQLVEVRGDIPNLRQEMSARFGDILRGRLVFQAVHHERDTIVEMATGAARVSQLFADLSEHAGHLAAVVDGALADRSRELIEGLRLLVQRSGLGHAHSVRHRIPKLGDPTVQGRIEQGRPAHGVGQRASEVTKLRRVCWGRPRRRGLFSLAKQTGDLPDHTGRRWRPAQPIRELLVRSGQLGLALGLQRVQHEDQGLQSGIRSSARRHRGRLARFAEPTHTDPPG